MNNIVIEGRLTIDPTVKVSSNQNKYANFVIADNYRFKQNEVTTYFHCVAYGAQTDVLVNYFKKGDPILVSGRYEETTFNDKKYSKIHIDKIHFPLTKRDSRIINPWR